jgi:hypothetical protein
MHDLDTGWGLASRPGAGDPPVGEERDACSARTVDPLAIAFEADLAAWLTWLESAWGARADEHAMHRLELVYGSGWIAITVAGLAIPLLGVTAAVLTVVFFAGMLVLGCVVAAPRPGRLDATGGSEVAWSEWSSLGPAERARLVRIINLSRVAARPPGATLLASELDEALAAEPLASWSPLRDLRNTLGAGWSGLIPFGSEALPRGW